MKRTTRFVDYHSIMGTPEVDVLIRSMKPLAISAPGEDLLMLAGLYDLGDRCVVRLDIANTTTLFEAKGAREFASLMLQLADTLEPRRVQ